MTGSELVKLFEKGVKRYKVIGNVENGIIAGLDLEGRLFAVVDGEVVNRVNSDAILGITTRTEYINPGGDGLWPAPEGTCFGYEYGTGKWRVPPGLTGAKFIVADESENSAVIEAEVDLVNAIGVGIPTIFRRRVSVDKNGGTLAVKVTEEIEYIGADDLTRDKGLVAPWSLCQFDCGDGCEVIFPEVEPYDIWDMYDPSDSHRAVKDGMYHVKTDATLRYQIGLGENVPWIELVLPDKNMKVKRTALSLPAGQKYIDIIDAPPSESPSDKGVRYSVYSDTNNFMEIEASGGCPDVIKPGDIMSVDIITEYCK